jgi:hypothetical protein
MLKYPHITAAYMAVLTEGARLIKPREA